MTKNEKMLKKAITQMEEVQKRAKSRTIEKSDIKNMIKKAQYTLEQEQQKWSKKYLKGVKFVMEYTLPNAYRWKGETSYVSGKINKYGNIESITVGRCEATKKPYGGLISDTIAIFE